MLGALSALPHPCPGDISVWKICRPQQAGVKSLTRYPLPIHFVSVPLEHLWWDQSRCKVRRTGWGQRFPGQPVGIIKGQMECLGPRLPPFTTDAGWAWCPGPIQSPSVGVAPSGAGGLGLAPWRGEVALDSQLSLPLGKLSSFPTGPGSVNLSGQAGQWA